MYLDAAIRLICSSAIATRTLLTWWRKPDTDLKVVCLCTSENDSAASRGVRRQGGTLRTYNEMPITKETVVDVEEAPPEPEQQELGGQVEA